jgi:hypothetical protein
MSTNLLYQTLFIMETQQDYTVKNKLGEVYFSSSYDSDNDWIYNKWTGDVTVQEVIDACQASLEYLEKFNCPRILNDNSQLSGSWDEANEWIAQNWMPRALAAGLKKFAHITSLDVFGALSAEELQTQAGDFEMRIFSDRAEAEAWLKE